MKPQEDSRFRALIENASDVITIVDAQGVIRYESPSVYNVAGFTSGELEGVNMYELFHPDDRARAAEQFETLVRTPGMSMAIETRLRHKDGSWRQVEAQGTNLLDNPDIQGIVINTRDITSRKVAEDKLRERTEELEQLNRFMIGRELRMIELKKELARLRSELEELRRADHTPEPC